MSLESSIITVMVALIGAASGIVIERQRSKRQRDSERTSRDAAFEAARLADESARRKEIDEASRELRDFLHDQVGELSASLTDIEQRRAAEREKWNQMLGELSTKNLELELQHRRDTARIQELEEDGKFLDDTIKELRTRLTATQTDLAGASAQLDLERRERNRLNTLLHDKE